MTTVRKKNKKGKRECIGEKIALLETFCGVRTVEEVNKRSEEDQSRAGEGDGKVLPTLLYGDISSRSRPIWETNERLRRGVVVDASREFSLCNFIIFLS